MEHKHQYLANSIQLLRLILHPFLVEQHQSTIAIRALLMKDISPMQ